MMFDIEMEMLPRYELAQLQQTRLKDLCQRLYNKVPFYQKSFDENKLKPSDLHTLEDIANFPFTEKQDLRDNYPFNMFAVPMEAIVRLHASTGTTGKATVVGYTQRDIKNWGKLMARCLAAGGLSKKDVMHNAYGYGMFTGGLGMHYGVEALGATVVPISGGGSKRQIQILKDFAAGAICSTPSYALYLAEIALEEGIDLRDLPLRVGIFGAEPWTEEMREKIENKLGLDALNIYGLSEVMGPGIAQECLEAKNGMHLFEDHFLPEIIDPTTGKVLPTGSVGELVLTTLTKEGMPLLRYRTRDITSLDYTPCICGRTHVRMGRIVGRSDDMLIVRGVNIYPQQLESVLIQEEGLAPHYEIEVTNEGNLDFLEVRVELTEERFASDEIRYLQTYEKQLQKAIKDFFNLTAKVRLVAPRSLQRFEGKASRVFDRRKEK